MMISPPPTFLSFLLPLNQVFCVRQEMKDWIVQGDITSFGQYSKPYKNSVDRSVRLGEECSDFRILIIFVIFNLVCLFILLFSLVIVNIITKMNPDLNQVHFWSSRAGRPPQERRREELVLELSRKID